MGIKEDFMKKTKMKDIHNRTSGVEKMIGYLSEPTTVYKMIIASDLGLPALTLIAKELEVFFGKNSNFPVVATPNSKNATNRQNVGRMIKFVLSRYGYTPIDGGLSEQARIPAVSGAKHFSTSAIYKKTGNPEYKINITSEKI